MAADKLLTQTNKIGKHFTNNRSISKINSCIDVMNVPFLISQDEI
jgi:hypothetical protein